MSDARGEKVRDLIYENKEAIQDVTATANEFYFRYSGKIFSLLSRDNSKYVLFGYPKWKGTIDDLIESLDRGYDDPDAVFINIYEAPVFVDGALAGLFEWLKSKHSGIDDFFRDLGVF